MLATRDPEGRVEPPVRQFLVPGGRIGRSLAVWMAIIAGMGPAAATAAPSTSDAAVRMQLTLRQYDFNKLYRAQGTADQRSSAAGGLLRIATAPFWGGFGLGAGLYGTWATEGFPAGSREEEPTLMGPQPRITTLGEAFVQYRRAGLRVRAGRQRIDTPWMSATDSRMLPQTFSGAQGELAVSGALKLLLIDVTRFKSRSSSGFRRDNLYYPDGYEGDVVADAVPVFPRGARLPEAPGTVAGGAVYSGARLHGQLWYYDFRGFARTVYLDGGRIFGEGRWRPYLDAQLMRQSGGGILARYGARLFGRSGPVDSRLWGARAGLAHGALNLSVSYDRLRDRRGGFGGGALISPYGDRTALYAGEMTVHLVKYGPGGALELAAASRVLRGRLRVRAAVLDFHTTYSGDSRAEYLEGTYRFKGWLQGLQLRDRLLRDDGAKLNGGRALFYNRLMLQYQITL